MRPVIVFFICLAATSSLTMARASENPFFAPWDTPFGVPPFDRITTEHYAPAFEKAMAEHTREIQAIVRQRSAPTFENTIVKLDRSGALLNRVRHVFFAMESALTNPEMQAIAKQVAPQLSQHRDAILLNEPLFQRVRAVYESRDALDLNAEQRRLVTELHKQFVRGGANLPADKKQRLKEINAELSVLSLKFGQNILKGDNRYEMVIDNEADLAGLPASVIAAAAEAAEQRGHEDKWVFTLHKPSWIPFLQYSEKRDLRERIYRAWFNRGNTEDELDNKQIAADMVALRLERARLLGFPTHAHYVLDDCMAKVPENVYQLLEQIWQPALQRARAEAADMQQMIDDEGGQFKLQPWDWWYYAEKVKQARYDLDEEMLRPYFQLKNVREGAFEVANRLWGLQFKERPDIPKYHPDVSVFEVLESDGSHVGILYVDYFPRESKRGGAWMSELRMQWKVGDKDVRPVVYNVGNFSKPTAGKPSLLSLEEVKTLFHEFGHALHGLLSDCAYQTLCCTNVARDFVELPSQIMENWAVEPEVLKMYARHYETGEPMPDALIEKIHRARYFNQGFATTEYLAASFLDMDWHTLTEVPADLDVLAFEADSMKKIGLMPEIIPRYRSPYFQHIFAGGYSAGYYSYVWAEVLDADAFQAFRDSGDLFDAQSAEAFRQHILARGGTEEPMVLYQRFRGKKPGIEPLLKRRGLQ